VQAVKMQMHNASISFLFLNIDAYKKESCCITLNSISSENKQVFSSKSKTPYDLLVSTLEMHKFKQYDERKSLISCEQQTN